MYKITIKVHPEELTKVINSFSKMGIHNFAVNAINDVGETSQRIQKAKKSVHKKPSETVCGKLIIKGLEEITVATSDTLGKEYLVPMGYNIKSASPKLSALFKEGVVDRILENGVYHYSLKGKTNDTV